MHPSNPDSPAPDTAAPCLWGAPDGFHKAFPWINLRKNKVFLPKAGKECADVFADVLIGKKRMDTAAFLRGYTIEEGINLCC